MKRLVLGFLLSCALAAAAFGQTVPKGSIVIPSMPAATVPLNGTDVFYVVQGGVSKMVQAGQLAASGCPTIGCTFTGPVTFNSTTTFNNTITLTGGGIVAGGGVTTNLLQASLSTNAMLYKNGPAGDIMFQVGGSSNNFALRTNILLPGGTWGTSSGSSGLKNNVAPIFQNATFNGTCVGCTGAAFGAFLQQTDNGSGSEGNNIGFLEHLIVSGANMTGGRNGGGFFLDFTTNVGVGTTQAQAVALLTKCNLMVSYSAGHTVCFGSNPVSHVGANVTSDGVIGEEIDTWIESGATVLDRVGLQIVDVTGSTFGTQSTRDDQALSLNNQYGPTSSLGYKVGIGFGRSGGNFPVATNGTMIYGTGNIGSPNFTVANGIDWHQGTATGNWLQFGSSFTLSGAGVLTGATTTGVTTNSNAATGIVGESVQSSSVACLGSTTGLTSGTSANVGSISLTAGDWDVTGIVGVGLAATTNLSRLIGSVSLTSATPGATGTLATYSVSNTGVTGGNPIILPTGVLRVSIAATTTVFAVVNATFTVSTAGLCGQMSARRIR